jgi:hypothetical protein
VSTFHLARIGGIMKGKLTGALLAVGFTFAGSAVPAAASTSGTQTFQGTIVTSGVSGIRTVVHSVVVAHGVLKGTGRIVEVDNLPGDPDNVSRDDLVFSGGRMHLISTTTDTSLTVNPHSCVAKVVLQQYGAITGGTGRFTNADGVSTATVRASAVLARNADGSCSFDRPPVHEVDLIASNGTLSL